MFVWIIPPIKGRTSFLGGSIFYFYIMSVLFASFYLYGCIWRWRTRHHHIGLWVGRAGPSRPILQVKQKKKEINIFPFAFLEVFACYHAITAKWKISSRFLLKKSQQVYFSSSFRGILRPENEGISRYGTRYPIQFVPQPSFAKI